MSTTTVKTVVKNKTTDRDRAFWSHVETVAAQSRSIRERSSSHVVNSKNEAATNHENHARNCDENRTERLAHSE
jgi:hypothetical protein